MTIKKENFKIKRKAFYNVKKSITKGRIPILVGLRRTGKTTILKQLVDEYSNSIILSFDDIFFRAKNDLELMNYIDHLIKKGKKYIFIDEIQTIKRWDLFVKNLFDRYVDNNKARFAVTGSSAISFEGKDTGVTRTEKILVHTLDFDEYLELSSKERNEEIFEHFLTYGGFPEFIESKDAIEEMLRLSLTPILTDDIPSMHNINSNNLIKLIFEISQITNGEFNIKKSSQNLGIKSETINQYLEILERTHIIKTVERIKPDGTFNRYRKIKIYINPHFHIWLLRKEFSKLDNKQKGHIIESYWLYKATQIDGYNKKFYYLKDKNNNEIDFVSLNAEEFKTLHEIKYSNSATSDSYDLMKNLKSKNKIVWCKEDGESYDGLVKFKNIFGEWPPY